MVALHDELAPIHHEVNQEVCFVFSELYYRPAKGERVEKERAEKRQGESKVGERTVLVFVCLTIRFVGTPPLIQPFRGNFRW